MCCNPLEFLLKKIRLPVLALIYSEWICSQLGYILWPHWQFTHSKSGFLVYLLIKSKLCWLYLLKRRTWHIYKLTLISMPLPQRVLFWNPPSPTTRKFSFSFKLSFINNFCLWNPPPPWNFHWPSWQWPFDFTPKAINSCVAKSTKYKFSIFLKNVILMLLISETDNFIRNGQIRLLCFCFAYCSLWKRKPPYFHQEMLFTHQTSQGYVTAATCNQSSSATLSWQTFVWPSGKFRKIFTNLWKVFKISTNVVNMYCECSV